MNALLLLALTLTPGGDPPPLAEPPPLATAAAALFVPTVPNPYLSKPIPPEGITITVPVTPLVPPAREVRVYETFRPAPVTERGWSPYQLPAGSTLTAPVRPLVSGTHAHKCPHCNTVWSHSDASRGDVAAHTCPRCGTTLPPPWNKHHGN
jgi:predicted RNA-binding Zn-ribbon protein involved in translation (DUF1610 family)